MNCVSLSLSLFSTMLQHTHTHAPDPLHNLVSELVQVWCCAIGASSVGRAASAAHSKACKVAVRAVFLEYHLLAALIAG